MTVSPPHLFKSPPGLYIPRGIPGRTYDYMPLSRLVIKKIITALVEGHSDGRRAAAATAAGRQAPTTLESIDISDGESPIIIDEAEGRVILAATEQSTDPSLPPRLDPPPTLTSLRSITGIPAGYELSCPGHGRHWQLPSLETVQVSRSLETVEVREIVWKDEVLGELVGTLRRLKELHVKCHPDVMAKSLAQIPVAAAGQSGPLSQLEDVGTFQISRGDLLDKDLREGFHRLQAVLVDRGCRSIKKLKVTFEEYWTDSSIFAHLSAIEAFSRTVCVSPDIPVDIEIDGHFDLSLLCDTPTSPEPSPFVQRHIQQLAVEASGARFLIRPHHLTTPLDTPSPAAIALAQSLTFPNVKDVGVVDMWDDWEPDDDGELDVYAGDELDDDADQPDPLVLDSIPDNAFPAISSLSVHSKGLAIGRRLVTKMPAVKRIELWMHPTEEQAVGMLQAVGGDRSLEYFEARKVTGVGEGGLTLGDMADQLPTIERLDVSVKVPHDLGVGDAAGEFGIVCVKSLLKIRGIKELKFQLIPNEAFRRLVDERTDGDAIEKPEGWFLTEWRGFWRNFLTLQALRGFQENMLILKPLDT
ncbi:unnamed protein product [Vitrella brassicaformis CCMP3155]|uniref:Uncharacterized protein n=1 Tax=Vitrella brassicaformis (strain CCMP3155) TaxID=1169540 RepID=A0A0G4H6C9_VITBC|nr:unnamed protein product [Vitrella brassicaformis CCMP3155]|eukprot:CEM39418.1 unnamed protein product [Vitrella brassicaformis CCMP3155]